MRKVKKPFHAFEATVIYIAKDSLHYAAVIGQQILFIVESLAVFPDSGRMVSEYQDKTLREKIFQNYRIVYRRKKYTVEIIAIMHSAKSFRDIS